MKIERFYDFLNESITRSFFKKGNHYKMSNIPDVDGEPMPDLYFHVNSIGKKDGKDYLDVRLFLLDEKSFDDTVLIISAFDENNVKIENLGVMTAEDEDNYYNGISPEDPAVPEYFTPDERENVKKYNV
jgi:hypothetical protein